MIIFYEIIFLSNIEIFLNVDSQGLKKLNGPSTYYSYNKRVICVNVRDVSISVKNYFTVPKLRCEFQACEESIYHLLHIYKQVKD